jgi:hypothetical protein
MSHRMYVAAVSLGSASLGLLAASITLHAMGCGPSAEDLFNTPGKCVASPDDTSPKCVCSTATDCPAATECMGWLCESNLCKASPKTEVLALDKQAPGDCKRVECAAGQRKTVPDNGDIPGDHDGCMSATCVGGNLHQVPKSEGASCSGGGKGVCNSVGNCVTCVEDTHHGCDQDELCKPAGGELQCVPEHCFNDSKDGNETDKDCGGSCKPCDLGGGCLGAADCNNHICAPDNVCCESVCTGVCRSCAHGTGECKEVPTGTMDAACALDMNKVCAKGVGCAVTLWGQCSQNEDCMSNNCVNTSVPDFKQCYPGSAGSPCAAASDCESSSCTGGTCSS